MHYPLFTRLLILFVLLSISTLQSVGQRVAVGIQLFTYFDEVQPGYDNWFFNVPTQLSLDYFSKLSEKTEYGLGLGVLLTDENYTQSVDSLTEYNDFNNRYISINLGVTYWPKERGKGIFLESELMPHFLVSSTKSTYSRSTAFGPSMRSSKEDSKDMYSPMNLLWSSSVGYLLQVYEGLSVQVSLGFTVRFGDVYAEVPEGIWRGRTLSIGAGYRFGE